MAGVIVKFQKLYPEVEIPSRQTAGSAAYDVRAHVVKPITIKHGEIRAISTGLKVEVPQGYLMSVRPRSGLALKYGVSLMNTPGTIDSDYRGEVQIILVNLGPKSFSVHNGERIAQLLLEKTIEIDWQEEALSDSERGEGGFGSTGRQ